MVRPAHRKPGTASHMWVKGHGWMQMRCGVDSMQARRGLTAAPMATYHLSFRSERLFVKYL